MRTSEQTDFVIWTTLYARECMSERLICGPFFYFGIGFLFFLNSGSSLPKKRKKKEQNSVFVWPHSKKIGPLCPGAAAGFFPFIYLQHTHTQKGKERKWTSQKVTKIKGKCSGSSSRFNGEAMIATVVVGRRRHTVPSGMLEAYRCAKVFDRVIVQRRKGKNWPRTWEILFFFLLWFGATFSSVVYWSYFVSTFSRLYIFFPWRRRGAYFIDGERIHARQNSCEKYFFPPIIEYDRIHPSNTMIRLF